MTASSVVDLALNHPLGLPLRVISFKKPFPTISVSSALTQHRKSKARHLAIMGSTHQELLGVNCLSPLNSKLQELRADLFCFPRSQAANIKTKNKS